MPGYRLFTLRNVFQIINAAIYGYVFYEYLDQAFGL